MKTGSWLQGVVVCQLLKSNEQDTEKSNIKKGCPEISFRPAFNCINSAFGGVLLFKQEIKIVSGSQFPGFFLSFEDPGIAVTQQFDLPVF